MRFLAGALLCLPLFLLNTQGQARAQGACNAYGCSACGSVVLMGVRHAAAVVVVVVVIPRFAMHMDTDLLQIHMAQVLMGALEASQG